MAFSSTPSSSLFEDFIRVQLDNIDHYQATPTALDIRQARIGGVKYSFPHVPVIRIFGSTYDGMKCLLHLHGVFPYLFIVYDGPLDDDSGKSIQYGSYSDVSFFFLY